MVQPFATPARMFPAPPRALLNIIMRGRGEEVELNTEIKQHEVISLRFSRGNTLADEGFFGILRKKVRVRVDTNQ